MSAKLPEKGMAIIFIDFLEETKLPGQSRQNQHRQELVVLRHDIESVLKVFSSKSGMTSTVSKICQVMHGNTIFFHPSFAFTTALLAPCPTLLKYSNTMRFHRNVETLILLENRSGQILLQEPVPRYLPFRAAA